MANAGERARSARGRQSAGEDEARAVAAKEIDERRRCRDITAHDAEGLGEGPLYDGQAMHQPLALGDAAAAWPIKPAGVNLIEIGHGAVPLGDIADLSDRRDIAVHGID